MVSFSNMLSNSDDTLSVIDLHLNHMMERASCGSKLPGGGGFVGRGIKNMCELAKRGKEVNVLMLE